MNTEQDDTNTTGPLATFVAALPPHIQRAFRPNSNSIPAIRALADAGVDLVRLADDMAAGFRARDSRANIQSRVTFRLQMAAAQLPETVAESGDSL